MTDNQNKNNHHDLWLESQKDAIRLLKPAHKVDVTDAVMQRVAAMPTPKPAPVVGIGIRVVRWAAAACVAGVVVASAFLFRPEATAATPSGDLAARLYDVYEYCNDYADPVDDDASYYDNPVTDFI